MPTVTRTPPTKPEALRAENARLRKEMLELGRMNRTMLLVMQGFAVLEKRARNLLLDMPEGERAMGIKTKIKAHNALPEPTFHAWCIWKETAHAIAVKGSRPAQLESDLAREEHASHVLSAARDLLANAGVRAWFALSDDGEGNESLDPDWDALKVAVTGADDYATRLMREHETDLMFHFPAREDAERLGAEQEYLDTLRKAVLFGKYRTTFARPPLIRPLTDEESRVSARLFNDMDALTNYDGTVLGGKNAHRP
jgi:hypothetical protein